MIKVESNMLVLDATLSKQDAQAINEFVDIARKQERDRMINLIERRICFDALEDADGRCVHHGGKCYDLRQLIKGEK